MIGKALLFFQLLAGQVPVAEAVSEGAPFDEARVPEPVLADQRGGIRLSNGIDVQLSIDTVTALDGRIVLQTVTKIAEGAPVITAYAPADGEDVALAPQDGAGASVMSSSNQPMVSYDRQHGLTVVSGRPVVPVAISSNSGGQAGAIVPGLKALDLTQSATTANGVVQTIGERGTGGVELQGMDISIVHLTGNAIGSAIANSGSDRAIDTQTTLSIDLRNAGPDVLGSAMLRVEDVALGAVASRF